MDDFTDQEGNISLSALIGRPKYPAHDPRHLPPEMLEKIARFRLEQMKHEQAANVAALLALENKKS